MKLYGYLGLVLIGLLAGYLMFADAPASYPEVIVPARVILEREPDTVRTFVDRIVRVAVEPSQVAVAPGGAVDFAAAFCRPHVLSTTDTVLQVDTLILIRSVVHDPGWFTQRDRLDVTAIGNTGDLEARSYPLRDGFHVRAVADSLQVSYPRSALLREIGEFGAVAFVTWLIAR